MIKVANNIYSVGAKDYDVKIFHGYETPMGTTYNAFLIIDDKITLIDSTKKSFNHELIENIEEICPIEKIDNIICNHIEPDHSGTMPLLAKLCPNANVYCTAQAASGLKKYYGLDIDYKVVKNGDSLNTGKYTFNFIPAPMVHWPDSMSTYLVEEKILFSNDALGQHMATIEDFDDELDYETLISRVGDYYANIILPFDNQVQKLLAQISKLDIKIVCPSHGLILRKYIKEVIESYDKWSKNICDENKVTIIYDTMWGATGKMAIELYKENRALGKDVSMVNLGKKHASYAMATLLESKYIFVGASTLNRNLLPPCGAFLHYLTGLHPKNRIGMAFGSYGWSGESIDMIHTSLEKLGWEMLPMKKIIYYGNDV